jgi:hypothetical protein
LSPTLSYLTSPSHPFLFSSLDLNACRGRRSSAQRRRHTRPMGRELGLGLVPFFFSSCVRWWPVVQVNLPSHLCSFTGAARAACRGSGAQARPHPLLLQLRWQGGGWPAARPSVVQATQRLRSSSDSVGSSTLCCPTLNLDASFFMHGVLSDP